MCSIIGYKGQLNAAPMLVDSLKQMEYRGYDSVGIAIISNGKVTVKKGVGNVSNITEKFNLGIQDGPLMVELQKKMPIHTTDVQIV